MTKLPATVTESPTVSAIYRAYETRRALETRRTHMGVSEIGKACQRAAWFDFRWAAQEQHSGRMLRLFDTGTLEEARLIKDLRAVGVTVWEIDPLTKQQWRFSDPDTGDHFSGSSDGIAQGFEESKVPHFLEFKTHNVKSFAALKAKGLKEAKPQHWEQTQGYMHFSGLHWGVASRIERTYYFAVCKDTDEIYGERVRYEHAAGVALFERAKRLIELSVPPERISDDKDSWQCRYCCHASHCHGTSAPAFNCRTCVHATPVVDQPGAQWTCSLSRTEILNQRGCVEHLFIPALLSYAVPMDSDSASVTYQHKHRTFMFKNGSGGWPSKELAGLDEALLDDGGLATLRATFEGAEVRA
jgi:hypothetical protein